MQLTAPRRHRGLKGAALAISAALVLAGCAAGEDDAKTPETPASEPSLDFAGPNGEVPGLLEDLKLTADEIAQIRAGEYTAAFVWHGAGDFVTAVEKGARDEFEKLGIEVVATTEADFDPAAQANNVQNVLARDPDIIVGIAADPTSAAASFQPIVDAGKTLVILTTPPAGYSAGDQFVSIVTENLTEAGRLNATLLGDALGGQGKVAFLYYDADFWFTQQRDQAFKDWLTYLYPDIEIVAEEGFADQSKTQDIAASVLARNPDLNGVYVSWANGPADGVLAALRDAGRTEVKLVTNDLDAAVAADMVRGGNVVGLVGNGAIGIGSALAISAGYGLLGKQAPELVASVPVAVTADNIEEAWREDYGVPVPASVLG